MRFKVTIECTEWESPMIFESEYISTGRNIDVEKILSSEGMGNLIEFIPTGKERFIIKGWSGIPDYDLFPEKG